jgi:hypothetical protein
MKFEYETPPQSKLPKNGHFFEAATDPKIVNVTNLADAALG